jgi:hypothetical protein
MSGLGKTRLASLMRDQGDWFHYSIDYRIGTAYMGEHITDNLKRQAMQVPFLPSCSCRTRSISAPTSPSDNLAPLSTFLGKPGDPGPRAACPSRNTCAGRTCTAGPRSTRFWTRPFHLRARDLYGYPQRRLRHRRVDLRGGGPRRPRTRC